MPRHADHEARHGQLADATLRVAGDLGLDGVTVARVAASAGVSVGLVQHYFPTKELLIIQAYARALERLVGRVAEVVEQREDAGSSIRATVVAGLMELLPIDDDRRLEATIRAQFHGRAVVDPQLAAEAERTGREVRAQVSGAVVNGRACGETAAGADPEQAAWLLWGLVNGLAGAMILDPSVPAGPVLAAAVAEVFPNPCQRA